MGSVTGTAGPPRTACRRPCFSSSGSSSQGFGTIALCSPAAGRVPAPWNRGGSSTLCRPGSIWSRHGNPPCVVRIRAWPAYKLSGTPNIEGSGPFSKESWWQLIECMDLDLLAGAWDVAAGSTAPGAPTVPDAPIRKRKRNRGREAHPPVGQCVGISEAWAGSSTSQGI